MSERKPSKKRAWSRISFRSLMLLGSGIVFPLVLWAQSQQSSSSAPAASLTAEQRAGRRVFLQQCGYCHLPRNRNEKSTAEGTAIGQVFKGWPLVREEKPLPEPVVRTFIQQGVPQKMPGFQYGLEPKEIDAVLAYLKTL